MRESLIAGQYLLTEQVGRGGFAVVWRARDQRLHRDVAAKRLFLPPHHTAEQRDEHRARTLREARSAARLNHPGAVRIYDVVEHDGVPWIIMEFVRGRTLGDIVRTEGPLPPSRAAGVGLCLLDALRAAHAAGVLHRDVKPSNVIVSDDRVVLSDFGIARIEGDDELTQPGIVMGAPSYTAPERARGEPALPESDLWSLGATLFYAVEGRRAFHGPNANATFHAILTRDPIPLRHAGPLTPVIEGLMRKDPAARPSPAETASLLAACDPAPFPRPSPPHARRAVRDRWELRGGSQEATRPTSGLPALPSRPGAPPGSRPPVTGSRRGARTAGPRGAPAPRADDSSGFHAAPRLGVPADPLDVPPAAGPAADGPAVPARSRADRGPGPSTPRGPAAGPPRRAAEPAPTEPVSPWRSGSGATSSVSPRGGRRGSPPGSFAGRRTVRGPHRRPADLRRPRGVRGHASVAVRRPVAAVLCTTALVLLGNVSTVESPAASHRAPSARPRLTATLPAGRGEVFSVTFSPDGRTIATGGQDSTVRLWSAAGHRPAGTLAGHRDPVAATAFSPDGKTLATGAYDGKVILWSAAGHREIATLDTHGRGVGAVTFSADGTVLATAGDSVRLWTVAGRRRLRSLPTAGENLLTATFGPHGRTLATAGTRAVRLWDVTRHARPATVTRLTSMIGGMAFSPDGKLLATGGDDRSVRVWDVGGHRLLSTVPRFGDRVNAVAFSPDGHTLACASGAAVLLWNTATGSPTTRLDARTRTVESIAFSPDGRTLATAGDDSAVRLWDLA